MTWRWLVASVLAPAFAGFLFGGLVSRPRSWIAWVVKPALAGLLGLSVAAILDWVLS